MPDNKNPKVKAALARSESLTPEQRKQIARDAARSRWDGDLQEATHESTKPLKIGDMELECAVLKNRTRVITQASFLRSLGRSRSPKAGTGVFTTADNLPFFLQAKGFRPFITEEVLMSTNPIFYRTRAGGRGVGYDARLLPLVAEIYLKFRDARLAEDDDIPDQYDHIIKAADILMRGLASVGILALVDENTGYEKDKARGDLERILEEFVAKELRPWVKTFPDEFYEQLFRLRGLVFPTDRVTKPQYFGHLTNDIVYRRLAPGVLQQLKASMPRNADGRPKAKLFQKLTENLGYRKLLEHLGSVTTLMRLSTTYEGFEKYLDELHPRFNQTLPLRFDGTAPKSGL